MAARASKLKSYSHSTLRPAPALNPDMLLLHSFATSYPRDCDRCTLRSSALPAPRGSGASYCCVARTSGPTPPTSSQSLRRRDGDVDGPVRLPSNPPSPLPRSTSTSPPTLIAHATPPCTLAVTAGVCGLPGVGDVQPSLKPSTPWGGGRCSSTRMHRWGRIAAQTSAGAWGGRRSRGGPQPPAAASMVIDRFEHRCVRCYSIKCLR